MPTVRDVIENITEPFRDELDREMFPCFCGDPGLIEIRGDIHCMECGNEITLCRKHAIELINKIKEVI